MLTTLELYIMTKISYNIIEILLGKEVRP